MQWSDKSNVFALSRLRFTIYEDGKLDDVHSVQDMTTKWSWFIFQCAPMASEVTHGVITHQIVDPAEPPQQSSFSSHP